jgi:hypothetical protein
VVEDARRRIVDEGEEAGDERWVRAARVGRFGGDPEQFGVVEEAPRRRDVKWLIEL